MTRARTAGTRLYATAVPGLGVLTAEEAAARGLASRPEGFDGRNDLVSVEGRVREALALRTTDDVFVEIGRSRLGSGGLGPLVRGILEAAGLERALSVYASSVRPLKGAETIHVVARVLEETAFHRTALRDACTAELLSLRPRWRPADPSSLEVWVAEYGPRQFRAGLRLTTAQMRHRSGRARERPGALRPAVAAAMLMLAGEPSGLLVDPCCGSGTVILEAEGWPAAAAGDSDREAVRTAHANGVEAVQWDARRLPLGAGAAAAIVSNLPFGDRFKVGPSWYSKVLAEFARVTDPDGRMVLLCPALAPKSPLALERSTPIKLLGKRTAIWQLRKA